MDRYFVIWLHTDGSQRVGPELDRRPNIEAMTPQQRAANNIARVLGIVRCRYRYEYREPERAFPGPEFRPAYPPFRYSALGPMGDIR